MLQLPRFKQNNRLQKASQNNPPLKIGDRGEAVALVQQGLVELLGSHYLPTSLGPGGHPNGDFNNETFQAIVEFQDIYGFAKTDMHNRVIRKKLDTDGIIGRQTLACMEENLSPLGEPIPSQPDWPSEDPGSNPPLEDTLVKNGVTDVLDRMIIKDPGYANTLANANVFIGSTYLGKVFEQMPKAGFVAGAVVQPLVWAMTGSSPDTADKVLYALGLFPPLAIPTGIVGLIKGWMDDDVEEKLAEVRRDEPARWARAIRPAAEYSWHEMPGINAQSIAAQGGVAWQHPNGLWVYIKFVKNGRTIRVCDYKPRVATKVLGPILPLTPAGTGRFVWRSKKGGF